MQTLRDRVAVVGFGVTRTGELWDSNFVDMLTDAGTEALEDAGLEAKDIQAAFLGTQYTGGTVNLNEALKLGTIPTSLVENACATGGDVFRNACAWVAGGLYDIVLAAGAEKLKDQGTTGIRYSNPNFPGTEVRAPTAPPVSFALSAVRYMYQYGLTYEQLKQTLGHISVKSHHNGTMNPKAAFQKEITFEQYIDAPMIAWPLGLYDCCANIDGAAACIVTTPEIARRLKDKFAVLKATALAVGDTTNSVSPTYDYVHFEENLVAARVAYEMAGIKEPFKEVSCAQVHDAFSVNELVICEDLGFAPHGKGWEYVLNGVFDLEGQLPVNTDGGLKCFGHPIGATGLKGIYEAYLQVTGRAGRRQIKNPRYALSHSMGGATGTFATVVTILSPRD